MRHALLTTAALALACTSGDDGRRPAGDGAAADRTDGGVAAGTTLPANKSGSRIKALRWSTADGVAGPEVIRDATLGTDCWWTLTGQDRYHCLPRDRVFYYPVRFADPQCEQLVYTHTRLVCREPPRYLITPATAATCPNSVRLFKRGAQRPERRYHFRHSSNQACATTAPITLGTNEELYDFGEELPLGDFVAGKLRMGAARGKLAPLFVDGEDGSSFNLGFRDMAGQFNCDITTGADGAQRCLPWQNGWASDAFSDSACTQPAGHGVKSSCAPEHTYLWKTQGMACGSRTSVFRATEKLAVGYQKFATSCDPGTAAPYMDYFGLGEEVEAANLVAAPESVASGKGRLRAKTLANPAGSQPSFWIWDSKLEVNCRALLATDGTYRCVPQYLAADLNLYADDQCSKRVALVGGSGCERKFAFRRVPDTCPERLQIFALTDEVHQGPVFVLSGDARCAMAVVQPLYGEEASYRALGEEVPPEDFVEMTPPP